jgi:hypothetical protein
LVIRTGRLPGAQLPASTYSSAIRPRTSNNMARPVTAQIAIAIAAGTWFLA